MTAARQEVAYMTIAVQQGQFVAFSRVKHSPRQAVRDLLRSLPDQRIYYLTFDVSRYRWSISELAEWITEFKKLYHQMVIKEGKAVQLPSLAVFADRFTDEQENPLQQVGAILIDRSLACNHDCQTTEQLTNWLAQNRQVALSADAKQAPDLPVPPAKGISPEDREALNSYPPGMTQDRLREILRTFESGTEGESHGPESGGRGR